MPAALSSSWDAQPVSSESMKGLKRIGMRAWEIGGPRGSMVIERDRRSLYLVRASSAPPNTLWEEFQRLAAARAWAEYQVGLSDHAPTPRPPRRPRARILRFEGSGNFNGRLETEPQPR